MAAPTPTARQAPSGKELGTGRRTTITLGLAPALALFERSVSPPGFEGGDPRDISSNLSVRYMQKAPNDLIEITPLRARVGYDPDKLDDILACVNRRDTVTVTYPTGATMANWGWLRSFIPDAHTKGQNAEADAVFEISATDPSDCSEAGPAFAEHTGTASFC